MIIERKFKHVTATFPTLNSFLEINFWVLILNMFPIEFETQAVVAKVTNNSRKRLLVFEDIQELRLLGTRFKLIIGVVNLVMEFPSDNVNPRPTLQTLYLTLLVIFCTNRVKLFAVADISSKSHLLFTVITRNLGLRRGNIFDLVFLRVKVDQVVPACKS